jgi:hypothetical protein
VTRLTPVRLAHLLFVAAFSGLLVIPMLTHNGRRDPGVRAMEQRIAAPLPGWPRTRAQLLAWPKQADDYLADHFGSRTAMVRAFNTARYRLFGDSPSEQAVFGAHGRLFLASHTPDSSYSLLQYTAGIGVASSSIATGAADLTLLLRKTRAVVPASYAMVVPTAPTLYPEDLPGWLRARWPAENFLDRTLPLLPPDLRDDAVFDPRPAMLAAKRQGEVIPRSNYHWQGLGAKVAATAFAETRLGLASHLTLVSREETRPSDIAHIIPGIPATSVVTVADFSTTEVQACLGAACFPDWGATAGIIGDLSRYRSPQAGPGRLLILSDSFGLGLAGWFTPYFGEVWHLAVGNLGHLDAGQRADLRHHLFDAYRPDVVLYVFNDGSVHYWPTITLKVVWAP